MPLEVFSFIPQLVATNPLGTDPKALGDDHIRGIKETLQNQFPAFTGAAVTRTEAGINGAPFLLGYLDSGRHLQFAGDLDTIVINSKYVFVATDVTNAPADFATDGWGFIMSMMDPDATFGTQVLYGMLNNEYKVWMRHRAFSVYGAWILITDKGTEQGAFVANTSVGAGSVTLAAANDTLAFTRIGTEVRVQGRLSVASVSTPSGILTIGTLPFPNHASLVDGSDILPVLIRLDVLGTPLAAGSTVMGRILTGGTGIEILTFDGQNQDVAFAEHLAAGSQIWINASYITDNL